MASRKKVDNKKKGSEEDGFPKQLKTMASYLRFNLPTNSTAFHGDNVNYFSGNKAVDFLLSSKYGSASKKDQYFTNRNDAIEFLQTLLEHRMIFRARKLVLKKKEDKKEGGKKRKEEETVTETEAEDKEKKKDETKDDDEEKKKKKKVKLEEHPVQAFVDDKDVYVWVYDPTPLSHYFIGVIILLGTVAGCLYPVWPLWMREGVYYLSMVAVVFLAFLLLLAVVKVILYGVILVATFGKHRLWIFPNLTEDCGFFESFQPMYTYEYYPTGMKPDKKSKKNKKSEESKSDSKETEETKIEDDKQDSKNSDAELSQNSGSEDEAISEDGSTNEETDSPKDTVRRRKVKRVEDDFVHVE